MLQLAACTNSALAWGTGLDNAVSSPLEFMQRLAVLVPRPRLH